jgi:diaminohydroxyphosphoribosylaminopyrimidine deaminase/5-amino-6-(5-phosphoribosylamino)uracil reductase
VRGDDELYMRRAIALARRAPFTAPNPRVGAVVVRRGAVLGEGWHEGPGTPHAEAAAIAGRDVTGATVYVTLEPCNHHGRTPPCAPGLVAAGVARVVVAHEDPDPRVRGRGLAHLRSRGVEVCVGVLAGEAERVNRAYLHHARFRRPLLTLKLALSLDGRMAASDGSARWITGDPAPRRVPRRRAEVDAVMVGAGTVLADDPQLTARAGASRQPGRVIVDGRGRVPPGARVFAPGAEVIVATTDRCPHDLQTAWKEAGAEVAVLPEAGGGVDLTALLGWLGERPLLELLCEGGPRLATSLLVAELVDRLELHYGPVLLGDGGPSVGDLGVTTMAGARRWRCVEVARRGDDAIVVLERLPERVG